MKKIALLIGCVSLSAQAMLRTTMLLSRRVPHQNIRTFSSGFKWTQPEPKRLDYKSDDSYKLARKAWVDGELTAKLGDPNNLRDRQMFAIKMMAYPPCEICSFKHKPGDNHMCYLITALKNSK